MLNTPRFVFYGKISCSEHREKRIEENSLQRGFVVDLRKKSFAHFIFLGRLFQESTT